MKLNPRWCVFGVTAGKFLGFMVSQRGIEVNPEKVRAIMELGLPRTVKEVQSLNGKIAALNRFISKATDKCLPFFRTLRKSFEWMDECQKAFEDLKKYISSPPLLSLSKPGEELYLYIAVSQAAVSAALVREEEGTQRPVYFVSKAFRLFCKQGVPGRRREVPPDGKASLRTSNGSTEAQALLPGSHYYSFDGPALEKSNEQP